MMQELFYKGNQDWDVWICFAGGSLPMDVIPPKADKRQHIDPVLGEEVAMKLVELEPQIPAPFVILSSIYAALE
ncbi:hypothetical protein F2Q68_00035792 [Brassica cretica]|uniref:Uncharacterized protein n=1 Tax=Brassica cretica TaxID=69181 RepID=A0A8S9H2K5_BRACR|nr:hypothetical protein F2Q68_00035792 [Brassica cretica]